MPPCLVLTVGQRGISGAAGAASVVVVVVVVVVIIIIIILTPWSRVLLEKLTGSQLVKKFPHFM